MREFNVNKKIKISALVASDILSIAAAFIISHLIVSLQLEELKKDTVIYLSITLINTVVYIMLFY